MKIPSIIVKPFSGGASPEIVRRGIITGLILMPTYLILKCLTNFYQANKDDFSKLGVMMVQKFAKKIEYSYIYKMNVITIDF